MKINIITDSHVEETEITICCKYLTSEIEQILSLLRIMDRKLTGVKDGQLHILDVNTILYIDTVDKKTFLYTKTSVYESSLRLYELEQQLEGTDFFRGNKSCIINFDYIRSMKAEFDGRLLVTMNNGEKLVVSRQYAPLVKKKLGVR